jgi:uncharacterized protein
MRRIILFEIFLIYYLPILLILSGVLLFEYRFLYLVIICTATIGLSVKKCFSMKSLGLSTENLKKGLMLNGLLSLLFIIFFLVCYKLNMIGREYIPTQITFYVFYIFVSCPLQEFTYRSYFFRLLDEAKIENRIFRISFNAITFSFLHAIYQDWLTLLFTLIMGALWGYIYQSTKNVYGICLSHIVFGTITILAGLV